MKIFKATDPAFKKYGRIIRNVDFTELIEELKKTPVPEGVVYEPSVEIMEKLPVKEELSRIVYGELPVQIGYCNGHNVMLNALEYHRNSEINVAAEDTVLMLGLLTDLEEDYTYDTSKVEAFLISAGEAVELYATTLHYAPCHMKDSGFQVAVVLPEGTNYPLKEGHAKVSQSERQGGVSNEDALLAAVNKWLIGHPEGGMEEGSFLGLKGKNLCLEESWDFRR